MRSLVLRAGTVAGVVAVLALPTTAARAATTAPTGSIVTSAPGASSGAGTGRIVDGEALALAVVPTFGRSAGHAAEPLVHRRPLGLGAASTGYVAAAEATP